MTWTKSNPAYNARYTDNWPTLSRDTKRLRQSGNEFQCSCCGNFFSWDFIEVHHAYYLGEGDTPGVNIFPVCGTTSTPGSCHHWLHLKDQWQHDKADPVWGSGNYQHALDRLRYGWQGSNSVVDVFVPADFDFGILARAIGGIALVWLAFQFWSKPTPVSSNATKPQTYTVNAPGYDGANLRNSPGGDVQGFASNGSGATVSRRQGDWCRLDGKGWIFCKFLEKNN